jgi:hypothetical protein
MRPGLEAPDLCGGTSRLVITGSIDFTDQALTGSVFAHADLGRVVYEGADALESTTLLFSVALAVHERYDV